jgi:hypothetical protein
VVASGANVDIPWTSGDAITVFQQVYPGGGSIRSKGIPVAGNGTRFSVRNADSVNVTIRHNLAGGAGATFYLRGFSDLVLAPGEVIEFIYDGTYWNEVSLNGGAGGGGGAIEYENAWAAGVPYTPGDVVIHNGIEYLAVNPSTGQTPPPSPAVAGATVIPLVTALPSSPFDGQEVDLTDSLTTPSYVWRFRYVASAPTNKWRFVGGAPISASVATSEATGSATYAVLATAGPSLAVPVAGLYLVGLGCKLVFNQTCDGWMSYDIGATPAVDADSVVKSDEQTRQATLASQRLKSLGAVTLTAKYRTTWNVNFLDRSMSLLPVAVG